jgi:hypothetical protein
VRSRPPLPLFHPRRSVGRVLHAIGGVLVAARGGDARPVHRGAPRALKSSDYPNNSSSWRSGPPAFTLVFIFNFGFVFISPPRGASMNRPAATIYGRPPRAIRKLPKSRIKKYSGLYRNFAGRGEGREVGWASARRPEVLERVAVEAGLHPGAVVVLEVRGELRVSAAGARGQAAMRGDGARRDPRASPRATPSSPAARWPDRPPKNGVIVQHTHRAAGRFFSPVARSTTPAQGSRPARSSSTPAFTAPRIIPATPGGHLLSRREPRAEGAVGARMGAGVVAD